MHFKPAVLRNIFTILSVVILSSDQNEKSEKLIEVQDPSDKKAITFSGNTFIVNFNISNPENRKTNPERKQNRKSKGKGKRKIYNPPKENIPKELMNLIDEFEKEANRASLKYPEAEKVDCVNFSMNGELIKEVAFPANAFLNDVFNGDPAI